MALPNAYATLGISQINVELGRASNAPDSTLRNLAALAKVGSTPYNNRNGQTQISDWYGYAHTQFITGGDVGAITVQSDGKILVGGNYTLYGTQTRNRLMRFNSNGTEDTAFYANLGSAFDGYVYSIVVQSDGKIIAVGSFLNFNGNSRKYIVRLNSNGTEDTAFYTSLGTGFNNNLFSIVIQPSDSRLLVGGAFTTYKGVARNCLTRLNTDMTEDTTFGSNSVGFNNYINAIVVQSNGSILVGGGFQNYKALGRNYRLARLLSTGAEDTTFGTNIGASFDATTLDIAVQSTGKIVVGGNFLNYKGVARKYLVRLNSDGTEDTAFYTSLGTSFNNAVQGLKVQSDDKILVAGNFTNFAGNVRTGLIRLNATTTEDTTFYTTYFKGTNGTSTCVNLQSGGGFLLGGSNITAVGGVAAGNFSFLDSNGTYTPK